MYINTFKYTPKDVSCQLCTEYVKKLGCTALRCPWLAERIEAGVAKYMNENVPGIDVPQDMIDRLTAAAAEGKEKGIKGLPMQLGIEMAAEMIARIHDEHLCDGVHIMAIGAEKNVPTILDKAVIRI